MISDVIVTDPDDAPVEPKGDASQADVAEPESPDDKVTYDGKNREGQALAALDIAGVEDRATIADWLARGLAVLEIGEPSDPILASVPPGTVGDPFASLRFVRPGGEEIDPRSELRVEYRGKLPMPRRTIEFRLAADGKGSATNTISLVFTHKVVAQILQVQTEAMANLPDSMAGLRVGDVTLTICIDDRVRIGAIFETGTDRMLTISDVCR